MIICYPRILFYNVIYSAKFLCIYLTRCNCCGTPGRILICVPESCRFIGSLSCIPLFYFSVPESCQVIYFLKRTPRNNLLFDWILIVISFLYIFVHRCKKINSLIYVCVSEFKIRVQSLSQMFHYILGVPQR